MGKIVLKLKPYMSWILVYALSSLIVAGVWGLSLGKLVGIFFLLCVVALILQQSQLATELCPKCKRWIYENRFGFMYPPLMGRPSSCPHCGSALHRKDESESNKES